MKDNRRAVTVGLFVLLGIIIFIVGVLVLGGQQKRFVRTVQIKAIFDDVEGLKAGNNVWFSGVKIGTVRRISFFGTSQVEVDMNIEEKSVPYIHKDALATLSSDGLIGNKIVQIVGGNPGTPPVEDGDRLGIQVSLSSEQLLDTLQATNRNLYRITNDFGAIVSQIKQGKGVAGAVLTDERLAGSLRETMTGLQAASQNAARVTTDLTRFSAKLNNNGSSVNRMLTDTVLYADLRNSTARLRQVSGTAQEAVNNVKATTEKLNNPNSPLGTLLTDQETGRNLKQIVRNLTVGTETLNEDLKAAQSNFLLRGYFRRKEKEKQKNEGETTKTVSVVDSVR